MRLKDISDLFKVTQLSNLEEWNPVTHILNRVLSEYRQWSSWCFLWNLQTTFWRWVSWFGDKLKLALAGVKKS